MSNLFPNLIKRLGTIQSLHSQQVRHLPRWSHRRPVKVIMPDEYDSIRDVQRKKTDIPVQEQSVKINWEQSRVGVLKEKYINEIQTRIKREKEKKPLTISKVDKSKQAVDMLEATIDSDGNFIYTKMKNKDSRISSILVAVKSKKGKEKNQLMLLEGKRLIKDALDAGCKLEYILFSRMKEIEYLRPSLPKCGAQLYKMPYREIQMWSELATSPGIMGIFKIPDTESFELSKNSIPLTIICDNIREPDNLGAILRTCIGVGCQSVILTKGCVNVWDSKVLRSASGAHFKLHITRRLNWDDIKQMIPTNSKIYIADNKKISTSSNSGSEIQNLETLIHSVPVLPYYGVDFGMIQHAVVIIGGETEGISTESYQLAAESKGIRLNVPLSNEVDSLNTGTALGIIVFEIKRQLLKNYFEEHDYLSSEN